jgi:phenylacetate-CoA ligase
VNETPEAEYFDELETRAPERREQEQFNALVEQIANAKRQAPALTELLSGIEPADVRGRAALAKLPIIRKSELIERQKRQFEDRNPFGGLTAVKTGQLARIYASPGPIYDPEAMRPDYWRMARAMFAAGFRRGNIVHNSFSYHLTPAASMLESGAHALGCAVVPAGTGNTELQVRTIADVKPQYYVGTPSFLKILLDKARELSLDVASLTRALVSGEALPSSLRNDIETRSVSVRQCYASADLGLIAYESEIGEGLIVDEWQIVEIVRPGTGDPVPDGEVGEVVVTTLNPDYPLIRFATGDLSAVKTGMSACGRTNVRLKGWMGRADQTTKVRGMFVHPGQIAEIARRHKEILRYRLIVDRRHDKDAMILKCEIDGSSGEGLAARIVESMLAVTKLRGEVEFLRPATLPNDGKVIDDLREIG